MDNIKAILVILIAVFFFAVIRVVFARHSKAHKSSDVMQGYPVWAATSSGIRSHMASFSVLLKPSP